MLGYLLSGNTQIRSLGLLEKEQPSNLPSSLFHQTHATVCIWAPLSELLVQIVAFMCSCLGTGAQTALCSLDTFVLGCCFYPVAVVPWAAIEYVFSFGSYRTHGRLTFSSCKRGHKRKLQGSIHCNGS